MGKGTEEPRPFTNIYYKSLEVCKTKCMSMKVTHFATTGRPTMNKD